VSKGRHSFKLNDAARLMRAVEEAGLKVKGVMLKGETLTVLVDGPKATKNDDNPNPWDQVLNDDSN
jgi:hypothetical protein